MCSKPYCVAAIAPLHLGKIRASSKLTTRRLALKLYPTSAGLLPVSGFLRGLSLLRLSNIDRVDRLTAARAGYPGCFVRTVRSRATNQGRKVRIKETVSLEDLAVKRIPRSTPAAHNAKLKQGTASGRRATAPPPGLVARARVRWHHVTIASQRILQRGALERHPRASNAR